MAEDRKLYYRRKRRMMILRNIFMTFLCATGIAIIMSMQGCAAVAGAGIAMSRDPIEAQAQRDACESGISEQEEHYHKTQTSVKHISKVVCK
jgi:hypothetical protein